jgi:hypothetical protein
MEKTLKLSADQAKAMLGKDSIMDALIKANFSNKDLGINIADQIKNFDDVLALNGKTKEEFAKITQFDQPHQVSGKMAEEIALAYNGGEVLHIDGKTKIYYAWMRYSTSGFGFYYANYAYVCTYAALGSRRGFKTPEHAEHAYKTFPEVYASAANG